MSSRALPVIGGVVGFMLAALVIAIVTRPTTRAPIASSAPPVRSAAHPLEERAPEEAPPPPPEPQPTARELEIRDEAVSFATLTGDALVAHAEDFAAQASEATYAMLERNADAWFGERAVFTGRIEEIHDNADGGSTLRLATRSYGANVLWVETIARPDRELVQGSRVRVYGYLAGAHTYQSQAGWTITIPALIAVGVVPASTPQRLSARARARLAQAASEGAP